MFDLKDKVFVLSGATGTLGSALTQSLVEAGVTLVLLGRNQRLLNAMVQKYPNHADALSVYAVDVLDREALEATAQKITGRFQRLDGLINAVGGNLPGATISDENDLFDMAMSDFDTVVDLNLKGTVLPSLIFGKYMAKSGTGAIVNYSSMAVDQVLTRVVGYSAAKAAVENFTRWMAVEMATKFGDGIRVNAVAPGFFVAKQNRKLLLNTDDSLTPRGEKIIRKTPMGRFGKPEELNGAVQFLLSESASFITGTVLVVDGGFSAYSGV